MRLNRREFLYGSAGVVASATTLLNGCKTSHPIARHDDPAPTMSNGHPALRAILHEADGSALDTQRARTLTARDMNNDPLPQEIVTASGRARVELNRDEPIQLCMRLKVPGFGEVYCYADNDGQGYTRPATLSFVHDAAVTRFRRV